MWHGGHLWWILYYLAFPLHFLGVTSTGYYFILRIGPKQWLGGPRMIYSISLTNHYYNWHRMKIPIVNLTSTLVLERDESETFGSFSKYGMSSWYNFELWWQSHLDGPLFILFLLVFYALALWDRWLTLKRKEERQRLTGWLCGVPLCDSSHRSSRHSNHYPDILWLNTSYD